MYPDGRGHVTRAVLDLTRVTSESPPEPERGLGADVTACGGLARALHIHPTTMSAADSVLFPAGALLSPAASSSKVRLPPANNIIYTRRRKRDTEKECHFLLPCETFGWVHVTAYF